jgi:plastocyanin
MIPVQNVTPSTTSTEITPVIATITISGFAFNPATLTVKKGTTVTWTNNDSVPHQIKSDSFNSDLLSKGQSYSMTFNDAGIFNYSCTIHPSMTGQLIVQ